MTALEKAIRERVGRPRPPEPLTCALCGHPLRPPRSACDDMTVACGGCGQRQFVGENSAPKHSVAPGASVVSAIASEAGHVRGRPEERSSGPGERV